MTTPHRAAIAGAALLALASCDRIVEQMRTDDRCGPEIRTSLARGTVGPEMEPYASAEVQLIETRGDSVPSRVRLDLDAWYTRPRALEGHVTRVRLLDPAGATLMDFPVKVGPGTRVVSNRPVTVPDSARVAALRTHLRQRDAVLQVLTDLPGIPEFRAPLSVSQGTGWQRAVCPKWSDDV